MGRVNQKKILKLKQHMRRVSIDCNTQQKLIEKARTLGFGDAEVAELDRVYGLTPLMEKDHDDQ
jgi:hypothetical protein